MSQDSLSAEGKAWMRGERVARFKLLYNQHVRVLSGPDDGSTGWIVGVDPHAECEPVYTVEIADGDPNAEFVESMLEPVT